MPVGFKSELVGIYTYVIFLLQLPFSQSQGDSVVLQCFYKTSGTGRTSPVLVGSNTTYGKHYYGNAYKS